MEVFTLHERLAADTAFVADWGLSRVLLMDDARYPWLILVPRRAGLVELHDLKHAERLVLIEEIARASSALKTLTEAAKINTGALGQPRPPTPHPHRRPQSRRCRVAGSGMGAGEGGRV